MRTIRLLTTTGTMALMSAALLGLGCGFFSSEKTNPDNSTPRSNREPPRSNGEPPNPLNDGRPAPPSNADIALEQSRKSIDGTWVTCNDRNTKQTSIFTKVVPPKQEPNPFTPVLTPPNQASQYGFYQFLAPISYKRDQVTLSAADQQNGMRDRYIIAWFTPTYRSWDSTFNKWTEWQTGRGYEKNNVKFLESVVTQMADGTWKVEDKYFIFTGGVFVKPECKDLPGG